MAVLQELAILFPSVARDCDRPAIHLEVQPLSSRPGAFAIVRNGDVIWDAAQHEELVPLLEWAVASAAVEELGHRHLLFHAGAVAAGAFGVVLPGASGSGKTTLIAGLLQAGFEYLSDEVAVVDYTTGALHPFAKSLCIKAGAWPVLLPLYPQLAKSSMRHRFGPEQVVFLPPPAGAASDDTVQPRLVVVPRYVPNSQTKLVQIPRSTAASALLSQSFNARARGPAAVARTIELLRTSDCFTLSMGDLGHAVALVERLVGNYGAG